MAIYLSLFFYIIQLNVLIVFLYKFISEASKCHMCKFYRMASNSLQAVQIVHELFDCPSYSNYSKYGMFLYLSKIIINPYLPIGLDHPYQLDESFFL